MARLGHYWRAIIVTLIAVLVFAWCAVAAQPQDNQRLLDQLHQAHQSEAYKSALKQLNSGGQKFNECSACHDSQGVVGNLFAERPMVPNSNCERCHGLAREASQPQPLGRPFGTGEKPGWLERYEHTGAAKPRDSEPDKLPNALQKSEDGKLTLPLRCGACHPDHRGKEDILTRQEHDQLEKLTAKLDEDKSKTDAQKFAEINNAAASMVNTHMRASAVPDGKLQEICAACHLPVKDVPKANEVLTRFLKAHDDDVIKSKTVDGDDVNHLADLIKQYPEIAKDDEKAIPFDGAARLAVRRQIFEAMGQIAQPLNRGCTPTCHSEHTCEGKGDSPPEREKQPDGTLKVSVK